MTLEFVRCIGLFCGLGGFLLWGAFQSLYCDHSVKPPKGGKHVPAVQWALERLPDRE